MVRHLVQRFSRKFVIAAIGIAAATGVMGLGVEQAHASLIGDLVDINLYGLSTYGFSPLNDPLSETVTVVDSAREVECIDGVGGSVYCSSTTTNGDSGPLTALGTQFIDIEEESITMQFTSSLLAGLSVVFADLDWVGMPDGEIVGFSLDSNLDGGFGDSFVTTTAHSVTVDLDPFVAPAFVGTEEISADNPVYVTVDLETFHPNPVPEPGTMVLLGTGLIGMLGYGWRRNKQTA